MTSAFRLLAGVLALSGVSAASAADLTMLVRTANLGPTETTKERLQGVLQVFKEDAPAELGLVALQEHEQISCGATSWISTGSECFHVYAESQFNSGVSFEKPGLPIGPHRVWGAHDSRVSAIAGTPWNVIGTKSWEIGTESWSKLTLNGRGRRYLVEILLQHMQDRDVKVRFYATHLSHGDQHAQRVEQVKKILEIVRTRVQFGELPPVIAGDFNFSKSKERDNYDRMNESFALANDRIDGSGESIDHIWLGRWSSFRNTSGAYTVVGGKLSPLPTGFDHHTLRVNLSVARKAPARPTTTRVPECPDGRCVLRGDDGRCRRCGPATARDL
jgi:hypothetical protein